MTLSTIEICCPLAGALPRSLTHHWDFGDGDKETTAAPRIDHTWAAPGTYTISVVSTDSTGVSTFGLANVHVDPAAGG